jgi:hypothetical protein
MRETRERTSCGAPLAARRGSARGGWHPQPWRRSSRAPPRQQPVMVYCADGRDGGCFRVAEDRRGKPSEASEMFARRGRGGTDCQNVVRSTGSQVPSPLSARGGLLLSARRTIPAHGGTEGEVLSCGQGDRSYRHSSLLAS